jgi:rare lipoprotein A
MPFAQIGRDWNARAANSAFAPVLYRIVPAISLMPNRFHGLAQLNRQMMARYSPEKLVFAFAFFASTIGLTLTASAETGIASVYNYAGHPTADGERASPSAMNAAHRTLPFGTLVRVTNDRTGRSVVVRINDRGPFVRGRVIDLTPAAAQALGFSGLAQVTLDVVGRS